MSCRPPSRLRRKDLTGYVLGEVPLLVRDLCARGYRQKDIAVLVGTRKEGEDIINAFVDYNMSLDDPSDEIRFVSEQSLKVANSSAVKIVLGGRGA